MICALPQLQGSLRHSLGAVVGDDAPTCWQDQATKAWRGKIDIAVERGEGAVRSKGLAAAAEAA